MSVVWVSQAGCRGGGRVGGLSLRRAGHECCVGCHRQAAGVGGGGGGLSVGQDMSVVWMSQAGFRDWGWGWGGGGCLCSAGHECCMDVTGRLLRLGWGEGGVSRAGHECCVGVTGRL